MTSKVSNQDKELAKKYDIDFNRYAVYSSEDTGNIVLEELDIIMNDNIPGTYMKKLVAYKIENNKTAGRYNRTIIGEIDMEVSKNHKEKTVTLDGYAAKNKGIMEVLFRFLENRAIVHGVDTIVLNDAFGKEKIQFLPSLGYEDHDSGHGSITLWLKHGLEEQSFRGTLKDVDCEVQASEK